MNIKSITTLSIITLFLSFNLFAAEYNDSKKPELSLEGADLVIIEKAISNNFKNLSGIEKKKLKKFLNDYKSSARSIKLDKNLQGPGGKNKKNKYAKKSRRVMNTYKNGQLNNNNSTK